ncbi:docking protein 3 [Parambassis ranga]|uniref:Docking protein 3 n=1 Tax=Parambassis ranga TaxID=210632 RepID=A0A6P7J7G5_9TELE|nr:docking protein 3-like [Parambassis ranga]
MDSHTKTGKLYLQPHKAGKKWKPVWLSLFPHSSSGVGRLEIQDMGGGAAGADHGTGGRKHHPSHGDRKLKVVRLSELISVLRLPPNAEACPMENMSAFCVETQDRTMVFAALKDECVDWVDKLCHSSFQREGGSSSAQLHMEENQIYSSADEVTDFWVVIQRTDAATRCGLQGSYWLQVGRESLLLKETQKKNIIREWPYELLRRYGRDKMVLTIEAGRRCTSGPGTFIFETQQAERVFSLIQSTIKLKTSSATTQNSERAVTSIIQVHSPLPKIPDMTSMASLLENKLRTHGRKSPSQEDLIGPSESGSAPPAPITLMPLPLVPTQDGPSPGHYSSQSDGIYADPADCIQSAVKAQQTTALYVDPASVLPLKPPASKEAITPVSSVPTFSINMLDSVYAEVYDKVSPDQDKAAAVQRKGRCFGDDEPIYNEPLRANDNVPEKTHSKPDPFAHLYAQVCKTAPSSGRSSSPNATPALSSCDIASATAAEDAEDRLSDVVYENLGII